MNESEKKEKLNKAIGMFLQLSHYVTIVKHVPGEIRLRISLSGLKALLHNIKEFTQADAHAAKESLRGLKHVRIHPLSRSAVITYDESHIPYDLWHALFGPKESREPEAVIEERLRKLVSA
ncbi:MAG: hypothetical protein P8182_12590 [Deltaproteobacteria bacterium]